MCKINHLRSTATEVVAKLQFTTSVIILIGLAIKFEGREATEWVIIVSTAHALNMIMSGLLFYAAIAPEATHSLGLLRLWLGWAILGALALTAGIISLPFIRHRSSVASDFESLTYFYVVSLLIQGYFLYMVYSYYQGRQNAI